MAEEETKGAAEGGRRAYLIRCWQEDAQLRFQAETISEERQRHGFADLDALLAWLRTEIEDNPAVAAS